MGKHVYIVKVKKPNPASYNPDRPISSLIRNQILHLSLAERHLDKRHRTGIDVYSIQTEGEASEYIGHLTAKLHPEGAKRAQTRKVKARSRLRKKNYSKTKLRKKN